MKIDPKQHFINAELMKVAHWPYAEKEAYKSGIYEGLKIAELVAAEVVTDRDIMMRFQRWTILLDEKGAGEFWNDIDWLRKARLPEEKPIDLMVELRKKLPQGMPVAWRWRRKQGNYRNWAYGDEHPAGIGVGDCEVEPLYQALLSPLDAPFAAKSPQSKET